MRAFSMFFFIITSDSQNYAGTDLIEEEIMDPYSSLGVRRRLIRGLSEFR